MKVYKVNEHLFEKSNKFIGEKEVDWMRYVTLQQGTGGSISANPLSGRKGTIVNLSQTTNTDYRFDGYSITGANLSSNQFAINNSDVTAQGIFTYYPKRSVTVTQQTGGTVVANPTTGHDGDTVTLSNTANKGYTFNNYSITGATLTGSQFNFSGSNVSVKPNYTHNVYNLTLQTNGHGKLVAGKTTGHYNDTTTLTATPSANYLFSSYSITGGSITNNKYKWGTTNGTVMANFYPRPVDKRVIIDGCGTVNYHAGVSAQLKKTGSNVSADYFSANTGKYWGIKIHWDKLTYNSATFGPNRYKIEADAYFNGINNSPMAYNLFAKAAPDGSPGYPSTSTVPIYIFTRQYIDGYLTAYSDKLSAAPYKPNQEPGLVLKNQYLMNNDITIKYAGSIDNIMAGGWQKVYCSAFMGDELLAKSMLGSIDNNPQYPNYTGRLGGAYALIRTESPTNVAGFGGNICIECSYLNTWDDILLW